MRPAEPVKIYFVLCDTMPLGVELKELASKNQMQLIQTIGGCFTMPCMIQLLTGQMPSDFIPNGLGYSTLEKYRSKSTKKLYFPWWNKTIIRWLQRRNWTIHLHNVLPDHWYYGDVYTDSYEGGYAERAAEIFDNYHRTYSTRMMHPLFLEPYTPKMGEIFGYKKRGSKKDWHANELQFIETLRKKKPKRSTFYFIEYLHYHSYDMYNLYINSQGDEKLRKGIITSMVDLLKAFDFNEPNAIFWFFGDHGIQRCENIIPKPAQYYSWALVKDNVKRVEPLKTKIISMRDFPDILIKKLGYKISHPSLVNKDKIYYVEDGRKKYGEFRSTTALAAQVVEWKENNPLTILQTCYFLDHAFHRDLISLDPLGSCKPIIPIENNVYQKKLDILEKAVINKFSWVKENIK